MKTLRSIDIDFDIHQKIETERKGFDEPEYLALRRLLKLPNLEVAAENTPLAGIPRGRSWSGKGVELPHGTELRMEYNGQVLSGHIEDGEWVIEGHRAKSPSDAAGRVATTKNGSHPCLNGWIYWEIKRPSETRWRSLKSLRP